MKKIILAVVVAVLFSGCASLFGIGDTVITENTSRMKLTSDNDTKIKMAVLDAFMWMDKTTVSVSKDGVVNVRKVPSLEEMLRFASTKVYRPEPIKGILDSVSDFLAKGGGAIISGMSLYYGHEYQKEQLSYNYLSLKDNNKLQSDTWMNYTNTYQNNSIEVVQPNNVDPFIVQPNNIAPYIVQPNNIEPFIVNPLIIEVPTPPTD